MPNLTNINSYLWAQSIANRGEIVQDVDVIKQRWQLAISTCAGSVPLDPYFASNLFDYIDQNSSEAGPGIRKEILNITKTWIPEISIKRITYTSDVNGGLVYNISANINQQNTSLSFSVSNGSLRFEDTGKRTILSERIPLNVHLSISLLLDNINVINNVPIDGFENPDIMLAWLQQNYPSVGQWTRGLDDIILIVNNNYQYGSMRVTPL
jgi:phage baseplate assembly protein W